MLVALYDTDPAQLHVVGDRVHALGLEDQIELVAAGDLVQRVPAARARTHDAAP